MFKPILHSSYVPSLTVSPPSFCLRVLQRLIAHGIIREVRATGLAEARALMAPRRSRRPRQDTGFWTAVHARFDELTRLHGAHYGGNTGWELWEDEVIAAD
ncbi:hypothetical protein FRC08_008864 [Ceratobasidium sp. 394]|nr:hypothetical protein FRC08_008864 [Ceratobasidium sp. 394]